MIFDYIVWDPSPILFEWGFLRIAWYGLLFAGGFLISQQILFYMFKQEGQPPEDVEQLTLYMVISTIVGARLGHVFFYQPDYYLSNPIDILKIWEGGLASHGAAIAIPIALWLYARTKPDQSYRWVLDRIAIVTAMTGALIRIGNFVNSEIVGIPTGTEYGVVFAHNAETSILEYSKDFITSVEASKPANDALNDYGGAPVAFTVAYKDGDAAQLKSLTDTKIQYLLSNSDYLRKHMAHVAGESLDTQIKDGRPIEGTFVSRGVPRHPAQLYESLSYFILFLVLLFVWFRQKGNTRDGLIVGVWFIWTFGLRFVWEFFKEDQVAFEADMAYNMGQLLSIPAVLLGFYFLYGALSKKEAIQDSGTGS